MNDYFIAAVSLSLSASAIALIVLLTKPLYGKKLSKAWQYYIWLVVIARLLIPCSPELNAANIIFSPISGSAEQEHVPYSPYSEQIFPFINLQEAPEWKVGEVIEPTGDQYIPLNSTRLDSAVSIWVWIKSYIGAAWLSVSVILLLRKIIMYNIYIYRLKRGLSAVNQESINRAYAAACQRQKIKRPPTLYASPDISAPMLAGLIKPFLLIPSGINLPENEMEMVLSHELIHCIRRDIAYKWLLQIALCIHWFNPLIYLVKREINESGELSCDETVLKRLSGEEKLTYGDALLAVIKGSARREIPTAAISVSMGSEGKQLKKRLEAIMKTSKISKKAVITAVLFTAFLIAGGIFTGRYFSANVNAEPDVNAHITRDEIFPAVTESTEIQMTNPTAESLITDPTAENFITDSTTQNDIANDTTGNVLFAMNVGRSADFLDEAVKNNLFVNLDKPVISISKDITMALSRYILTSEHTRFVFKVSGLPKDVISNHIEGSDRPIRVHTEELVLKDEQGELVFSSNDSERHLGLIAGLYETSEGVFLEVTLETPDNDMRAVDDMKIPDVLFIELNSLQIDLKSRARTQQEVEAIDRDVRIDGRWTFELPVDAMFKKVKNLYYETINPEYCDENGVYVENFYSTAAAARMEIIIDSSKNTVQLPSGDLGFVLFEDEATNFYKNPYEQKLFVEADGKLLFETAEYIPYEGYDGEKMYTMTKYNGEDKRPEITDKGMKYFLYLPTMYFANAEYVTVRVLDENRAPIEVKLQLVKE